VSRADDLRDDYDRLGAILHSGEITGSEAASLARERRLIGEMLEALEAPAEVSLVDQLASRRQSRTKPGGAAGRRRQSG
jgi:hypothetical protein